MALKHSVCCVQVHDLLSFKAKSSVIMAYGSSGAGKTFTIEVLRWRQSFLGTCFGSTVAGDSAS
jgi:hypothetical protein